MANFVECSIRNRLSGERMFDALEQFIKLYEETDENLPERDAMILGTNPNEIKVLYSRDELGIHEILCKKAFKIYLKSILKVLINVAIVAALYFSGSELVPFAMGFLLISSFKYTKTCKDWLFQDKQKKCLKQKKAEEKNDV